jgi:hypothetical protein
MINRKKFLGKAPDEAGVKDAIHNAIVSVVAGEALHGGGRIKLNDERLAVNARGKEGFGIADPFRTTIARGDKLWVMLDPDSIDYVAHTWDNGIDYSAPTKAVEKNRCIGLYAKEMGVSYEQLMDACSYHVASGCNKYHQYPGTLSEETVEDSSLDIDDLWYEWSEETGHEFENIGSACCAEYEYPGIPFEWK